MIDLKAIPKNWHIGKFGEVCKFSQGIQVDISKQAFEKVNGHVRFLRIVDFTQEDEPPRYTEHPGEKYFLKSDEIAMVRYGTVGFVCTGKEGVIANNLFKVIPNESLNRKYLINFLNSHEFRGKLKTKGATMQALSFGMINPIPIPIPPLEVQTQIVSKIEELFSELDKGIEELITAQQQLKVYRQAVLKWAFEGKLTNEDVKNGELQEGWRLFKLKDITQEKDGLRRGPFGSAIKKSFFVPEGYKVYEQGNAINDDPYRGSYYVDENKYRELVNSKVLPKDLIVSCSGVTLGRISEIPEDAKPGIINQALLRIRLKHELVLNKFFIIHFRTAFFQRKIFDQSQGTAMPNLVGIKDFKEIELMLPTLEEQQQIVQEIESRLSVCDKIEEIITDSLKQAEALRQSILKKAFSGELI